MRSSDPNEVVDFVGQRTVYSFEQVRELCANGAVLALRFRLDRVLDVPIDVDEVVLEGAVLQTPQSIAKIRPEGENWIRRLLGA